MAQTYTATASTVIKVPPSAVWEALTNPVMVKKYFFGVDLETDWKVGSPITYRGVWEGKEFVEKGNVLKVEEGKLLLTNYFSPSSGLPDKIENYQNVAYELEPVDGGTRVTITQDNNLKKESAESSEANWKKILEGMKKLLEA